MRFGWLFSGIVRKEIMPATGIRITELLPDIILIWSLVRKIQETSHQVMIALVVPQMEICSF